MNDYSLDYLRSIAETDLQKRIVELVSSGKTFDEIIKCLVSEMGAGNYD